ncbi:small G protein signaling modulator 2-like isoform X2 [Chrysoperla carnea]|uniref:small G protein signaling modulator 2-like isoform X2 n=1 Tax=Chrysoperla carnea TaxID=189513 RepID=UPI001D08B0A6|nr:small G protein signaling modulator 2-like isoform X2 [Chrysoperla carnea]
MRGTKQQNEYKERLIAAVKKEVKQVMEEAVTRKFIHEESGSVLSLCAAVEACLSQGLRRRALGLFKTSSTTALLHKVAKHCPEAASISKKVQEIENSDPNRRSSSSGESTNKPPPLTNQKRLANATPRYLWIRLALFDKQLARIIDHLATHASRYYDRDALVADPDYGSILSSLLVGPCALEYSRTKTPDHFWTDPPADELVQRHRISSGHTTPPSVHRPILNFGRSLNTSSEDSMANRGSTNHVAKDYVESLHQNSRATLLYGKNNVMVLPKELNEPIAGYLSLHQTAQLLTIKWTPNQLMNGFSESEIQDKSAYWQYALNVRVDEIVYVHCHQSGDSGGTVILVGQDGVQRSPIHFPKGGHLIAFLSCLETGLLPQGRLEPPLWSQHGKVLPTARTRRPRVPQPDESIDYVFRVVSRANQHEIRKCVEQLDTIRSRSNSPRAPLASSSTSSDSSSLDTHTTLNINNIEPQSGVCIQMVCTTMRRQIISRAFYGWLAYCRHLRTVRTHLSGLVKLNIIPSIGAECGLTKARWENLNKDGIVTDCDEIYRLAYFGGVEHEIRKEVWPYLLGHYKFGSSTNERTELAEQTKQSYETTMSEWLAVEAIVRQRDKETTAVAIAKLSSESTSGDTVPPVQINRDLSNDVFVSLSSDDDDENEEENEDEDDDDENLQDAIEGDEESIEDRDKPEKHSVIVTNPSVDMNNATMIELSEQIGCNLSTLHEENGERLDTTNSNCVSPASSNGGIYSTELLETFGLNLHRIDKDVQRCDRNYWYFSGDNLEKLRNVMCTFVWEHLDVGYMQGMCDLVAPLLVILDDESLAYACFCHLMERMIDNFPNGGAMDTHLANMRSLIQILDAEMYELMHAYGDYTHLYFCYRWFLLDFKRELLYADVYAVWEVIWAAKFVASPHFVLFLGLALLETYRDIILSNSMDFTDIIKFFNEMAEHHDAQAVLQLARDLVLQLQTLMENK